MPLGLPGERKKLDAQPIQLRAFVLLDHALGDQGVQDPVHRALGQPHRLGEPRDASAVRLRFGQRANHGKRALQHARAGRLGGRGRICSGSSPFCSSIHDFPSNLFH